MAYIAMFVASPISAYMVFRILQCEKRTHSKTDEFYGQGSNGAVGEISDVFKHVYVSLLLRNYLGRTIVCGVMVGYEFLEKNKDEWERQMDFHNNKIGRHTKYATLKANRGNIRYSKSK